MAQPQRSHHGEACDGDPGWKLTLDVAESGYWFMIKDTTDACGFAYISNHSGLIYTAEHLR